MNTSTATTPAPVKGYTLTGVLSSVGPVMTSKGASPKSFVKAKFETTLKGKNGPRVVSRTLIATGAAYEATKHLIVDGATVTVRAKFERAPAIGDAKQGGEFITVLGLPKVKEAVAA